MILLIYFNHFIKFPKILLFFRIPLKFKNRTGLSPEARTWKQQQQQQQTGEKNRKKTYCNS